ncbi:MAG: M20/M25/M40 family metallo-hydrolase [Verrucomicrobia bacterium]|nr:M20/M25/M40 family metallo-hydrolase [Verrucomicrobiota bacterium]
MTPFVRRVFCVVLGIIGAARLRAELSPEEKKLADWLAGQQEEMIALLEKSVKIDSPSENVAGVRAMHDLFAGELQPLGFTPRWVPLAPSSGRAGHLFADHQGARGQRVLMIGHLDTVLPGGRFVREGDRARGSGTSDMKGGDIILIYAIKALHAIGALAGSQITVAMTGDEESIGRPVEDSRRPLIEAGKACDVALCFEGGSRNEATTARRGASNWELEVTAPTGHSSGIFSAAMGSGAIYEAARVLDRFQTELRKLPGLTANVSLVSGGAEVTEQPFGASATGKANIIPARAIARGDIRAVTPEQLDQAEQLMRDIVAQHLPRTETKFRLERRYPPMASGPRHLEVLALYDQASRDLGQGPVAGNDPTRRGAGDAAFVAPYCGTLDGLGIFGSGAHADRESADLKSLVSQSTRAAVLLYRLTR